MNKIMLFMKKLKILEILKYVLLYFDNFIKIFIKKPINNKNDKKQVMFLASFGIGDAIAFLSTIDKYKKLYPKNEYETTIVCTNKIKLLIEEEADFDNIIVLNIDEGTSNLRKRFNIYKKINEKYYDILIDLIGPAYCGMNVYTSHASFAKEKITIINPNESNCPKKIVKKSYTKVYEVKKKHAHIIDHFNNLVDYLNCDGDTQIIFHEMKEYKIPVELPDKYYIVFPSSSAEDRNWNLEKFAQIIKKIYNKTNLPVVFIGTKSDEKNINKVIELIDNVEYINLLGRTNLLESIQIIKKCKFCVTNDTGNYHIAVSEGVPVAIITGGYHFDRSINYNIENDDKFKKPYIVALQKECFNCCGNCKEDLTKYKIWPCLENIDVEYAWNKIEKMIDENL